MLNACKVSVSKQTDKEEIMMHFSSKLSPHLLEGFYSDI